MDLKEFLLTNGLINKAELARLMYPGKKDAVTRLNNKVKEVAQRTGNARLTDDDRRAALAVLDDLAKAIQEIDRV